MAEDTEDTVVDQTASPEEGAEDNAFLDMPDDDFQKVLLEDFPDTETTVGEKEETTETIDETAATETTSEDDTSEEEEQLAAAVEEEETDSTQDDSSTDKETTSEEDSSTEEEIVATPENQLKELFAPFKANNREMQVANVDEARQLMQMGANYNKKMAALRPNLKLMKMLQNNELLDEERISYLIDLDKKNPDAIKKLVKESKIDLESLDNDDDINYKPNTTYNVNDKEIVLDETFNDIKDTDSYAQTLDIIGNKWDESSRQVLLENPTAIRVLNDHVTAGHYEKITAAVETERMFGRLPSSMSDLEAYKHVADMINANGGFNDPTTSKSITKPAVSKTAKTVDHTLTDRKKAASSTKGSSKPGKAKSDLNPLSMSDEEFEKMGMSKFI
jgi:hypothetical protein